MTGTNRKFSILDIAQIGIMVAVIEVSKLALSGMPNIELTSFWLIMFTLFFGWKIVVVVPVFILIEGAFYGIHIWWIMYLYAWPLLVFIAWIFRKNTSAILWAVISGIFGLCFGALCSIPYFVIGLSSGGVATGLRSAITWWIAGIPWDFIHCAGNFIIMLVLYYPISHAMKLVVKDRVVL
ncbi:hypothetical protein [Butyrivibrio sp. VCD2006]|uniref:hypothetical protein n=1 Tax=Butyrivibrio sp. VCD2006 TaxID=1280664 RepID=UPI000686DDF9|nr:hypothetical protein [Butyrivibrio sp. VCD2006]